MNEKDDLAVIATKILEVMELVGAIAKDQTNQHQKYKYRGIDDLYANLQPALLKAGVLLVPTLRSSTLEAVGTKMTRACVTVDYLFIDSATGASLSGSAPGEGLDSSDKALNKAWTAAFKYFLFQVLCIPTENSVDADSETPEQPATITASQYKTLGSLVSAATKDPEDSKALRLAVKDAIKAEFGVAGPDIPAAAFGQAKAIIETQISELL